MSLPTETLEQLKAKFNDCWIRGTQWRLEVGELLYKIKQQCDHGKWGEFLAQYELARSTADDYVRRYEDEAQITVPRQFDVPNPEPDPDPEADERKKDIEDEKNKRKGRVPIPHQTELHVRVKDLTSDQLALYRAERDADPDRVNLIWQNAFFEIIAYRLKEEDELPTIVGALEEAAKASRPRISIQQPEHDGGAECTV